MVRRSPDTANQACPPLIKVIDVPSIGSESMTRRVLIYDFLSVVYLTVEAADFQAVQTKMRYRGVRWLQRHGHLDSAAAHTLDSNRPRRWLAGSRAAASLLPPFRRGRRVWSKRQKGARATYPLQLAARVQQPNLQTANNFMGPATRLSFQATPLVFVTAIPRTRIIATVAGQPGRLATSV